MTRRINRADARPTWTHLVLEALRTADDFMSFEQIAASTGASHNQLSATLHHLQNRKAVEAVEVNGKPWWFATGADTRTKTVDVRVPEEPGNRRRGPRRKAV